LQAASTSLALAAFAEAQPSHTANPAIAMQLIQFKANIASTKRRRAEHC
jgi:hypothetical protein